MTDGPITLVVRYLAADGNAAAVADLLGQHASASRAEPGCAEFTVLQSTANEHEFVIVERYADQAAFDAHRVSPHFEGIAVARIRPLLTDRTVDLYAPLSAAWA
jgi:quinol monooxygenase YgiN